MIFIKQKFKIILCIFIIILLAIPFSGCDKTEKAYIYLEIPVKPTSLDPQIASSESELIIVKNIHEGLLRKDSNGKIVNGIAESYSKNGLTYTFKLRRNAKWSNGEGITADDFVFAFKRGVNPETSSPFAARLFSIKNAKEIYNGALNVETLGVKAIDSRTLTITLIEEDNKFEETLTTSVAMPCNEDFFVSCKGKYGLSSENILSSGSYKLTKWSKESFGIRLYKNKEYNGFAEAKNAAVFINGLQKDETTLERLENKTCDISFIDCTLTDEAKNLNVNTVEFQNICWVLTLGNDFTPSMRKALSMLVGGDVISPNLPVGYSAAASLFPSVLTDFNSPTGITPYDIEKGKELYLNEIKNLEGKKFPSNTTLYYYDNGAIKDIVTSIVGHWQNNYSAFINIEAVSSPELLTEQLKSPSYNIAIFPVTAESNNLSEYLIKYGVNYTNQPLDEVQTQLLKSNNIIPLVFQNTVLAYTDELENVNADYGDGFVDFSYIIKHQ